MEVLEQVKKQKSPLSSSVKTDEYTDLVAKAFDYKFDGVSDFYGWEMPKKIPDDFNIGIIVGASGSGKSTLLNQFGEEELIEWTNDAIVSNFASPEEAVNRLCAVGLNSIPSWVRPYSVLSTGEKFRADLARRIKDNAVIDEFTSVVNRSVAKATSVAISKYIKRNSIKRVVFASCHEDIIEWLEPDWVFNTDTGTLYNGRYLRRPKIHLEVYPCKRSVWEMFKHHHYLSGKLVPSARTFLGVWEGEIVAFGASIAMPSGTLKNAWRGHRTVVLPDYQGMGIGSRLSDMIAQIHIDEGKRYYSRTAHPKFGQYRDKSPKWKKTSKYRVKRNDLIKRQAQGIEYLKNHFGDADRICYSHEYIGGDDGENVSGDR